MSGRKVFTAGEVLQAADVNDYLMDQSVMVFAGTAARGSAIPSPTEGMVTYLEDADELQVYTTDWGAVSQAGILQVVSTFKADTFSTTSATPVDITGASVTITPSSASSKVLITFSGSFSMSALDYSSVYLLRDSTEIAIGAAAGSRRQVTMAWTGGGESNRPRQAVSFTFLDSPNTASAVTYKLQGAIQSGSTFYLGRGSLDADNNSHTNSRSGFTMTAMEVAG